MSKTRAIDTGTEDILARVEDRVAILTMNRPKRRNALSAPMLQGMQAALIEAETADDVGCVVLTGAENEKLSRSLLSAFAADAGRGSSRC